MSAPVERRVDAGGLDCRIWEKGTGPSLYWLAPPPLLYRWTEVHEGLAARFRLVVCSLPGFPGNGRNHVGLDSQLDWCIAARDLLAAAGFEPGGTLMGSSTAGALAADVAAVWPDLVGRLILVAPHGIFDAAEPTRDIFALHPRDAASLLSARPDTYKAQIAQPEGIEPVEWAIVTARANEAAARYLWPLGNTRVARRLPRATAPTLLIWGSADAIIPPSYAGRFRNAIGSEATIVEVAGAGHNVEIDAPQDVAEQVVRFAAG
ncbi:alpha/beta fold hydrolase [Sphingomonas sp.]|uniref:alpha/beta fold hydrolase n=1 Tax=Sphingomonas sp. TaxID=28214 RepID=UPI002DD698B1|nr:alpha/beta hydrolase [Sphingomonas sp.]